MRQLTRDEAIQLGESRIYEDWTARQRALFQMQQDCLCMPFDAFHAAVEEALARPVFTHEFGLSREGLLQELLGQGDAPTFDEIIALLPPEKTIIVQANA